MLTENYVIEQLKKNEKSVVTFPDIIFKASDQKDAYYNNPVFQKCEKTDTLAFNKCQFDSPKAFAQLLNALIKMPNLRQLTFIDSGIGGTKMLLLAAYLKYFSYLSELYITDSTVKTEGALNVINNIPYCSTLINVSIKSTAIKNKDIEQALTEKLCGNRGLCEKVRDLTKVDNLDEQKTLLKEHPRLVDFIVRDETMLHILAKSYGSNRIEKFILNDPNPFFIKQGVHGGSALDLARNSAVESAEKIKLLEKHSKDYRKRYPSKVDEKCKAIANDDTINKLIFVKNESKTKVPLINLSNIVNTLTSPSSPSSSGSSSSSDRGRSDSGRNNSGKKLAVPTPEKGNTSPRLLKRLSGKNPKIIKSPKRNQNESSSPRPKIVEEKNSKDTIEGVTMGR